MEAQVFAAGHDGRATRAAIDFGRRHAHVDDAVEAGVLGLADGVTRIVVVDHFAILADCLL